LIYLPQGDSICNKMIDTVEFSKKNNQQVVQQLYDKGWAVVDHYISDRFKMALLEEQQDLLRHGQYRHAGVGNGTSLSIKPEIRSDKVMWIENQQLTPHQKTYWEIMETLRSAINQRCYLGLKSFEAHFAMYPPGSFYVRHLDQFQHVKYRIVTVILYLNEKWQETDGGALRLYLTDDQGHEKSVDFSPLGGRLVVFLSGEIPHEVLPTTKERISITGWFRDIE
jgi:SM-20-related protein